MKIYCYTYTITLPSLKKEERKLITDNVTELIDEVKTDRDKYYISNQEVLVFNDGKKIEIDTVINPF